MSKKSNNKETEFVNPFKQGVTYNDFLEALGNKTIAEYCGDYLSVEEIAWLEIEIEHLKNKK